MRALVAAVVLSLLPLCVSPAQAIPVTYDFEEFLDSDEVTTLLAPLGVTLTLTNAAVITAGITLNELDFPPVSGSNVLFDTAGTLSIAFSGAVSSLSGFFTYNAPLTLSAYLGGALVGSVSSAFLENYVTTGNAPNELLALSGIGLFDEVQIVGGGLGGSFTLDNLTVDVPEPSNVPEPGTLSLMAVGAAACLLRRRKRGSS